MSREVKTVLVNMCMIVDKTTNCVLVQDKLKKPGSDWCGITFPGGHVESMESLLDSTIREVKEETGLTVENLQPCGIIDWCHEEDGSRFLCFLYRTSTFTGKLIDKTEEGAVFWLPFDALPKQNLAPDMHTYLKLFLGEGIEAFGISSDSIWTPLVVLS